MPEFSLSTIKAVIADDEVLSRDALRHSLHGKPGWSVVAEASNGNEVVSAILDATPDVLFLDVEMPGMNGIAVAESIRHAVRSPLVVFVTAYEQYALQAFKVNAAGYLMKPFDDAEFDELIQMLEQRRKQQMIAQSVAHMPAVEHEKPDWLRVKHQGAQCMIPISKIVRSVSARNYMYVYTEDAEYLLRASVNEFVELVYEHQFIRTHRSIVVNMAYVELLAQLPSGAWQLHLKNGVCIAVSKAYLEPVCRYLKLHSKNV